MFLVKDVLHDFYEVYFYAEGPDGFHLSETFHTVGNVDALRKINAPECVKKSRTRWTYKFSF